MIFAEPNTTFLAFLETGSAGQSPAWRIVAPDGTPVAAWSTSGVTEVLPGVYRATPTAPNATSTLRSPHTQQWATALSGGSPTVDAEFAVEQLVIGLGMTAARIAALDHLDADVSSRTSLGSGSIEHTHTVKDEDTGDPLDGVTVWITTGTDPDAAIVASGVTDDHGKVTFLLDPGVYRLWEQQAGWDFPEPVQIAVA